MQTYDPLPVLSEYSEEERRIAELQTGFATRLRQSAYYVVEQTKSIGEHVTCRSTQCV